jgi:hypothetical protein
MLRILSMRGGSWEILKSSRGEKRARKVQDGREETASTQLKHQVLLDHTMRYSALMVNQNPNHT